MRRTTMKRNIIGIDIGKSSFHVSCHDACGHHLYRKRFTRPKLIQHLATIPPAHIAFEACGGCHWLGRLCLLYGHTVSALPPQFVKPYVKNHKNDFLDAEAIAEAASRPSMRFVPIKSEDEQITGAIHRVRQGYVKERTACMSRIGALLLEFGVSFPQGHCAMKALFMKLAEINTPLPQALMLELQGLHEHYLYLNDKIVEQDNKLKQIVKESEAAQLLTSIPGIGVLTASQCIAAIGNASQFKQGRQFGAWLGLVPRQHSTGGKPTLLGISKRGDKHLRTLFIHCARSILSRPDKTGAVFGTWLSSLLATKPFNVACVALANKLARIAWAVLRYQRPFEATAL